MASDNVNSPAPASAEYPVRQPTPGELAGAQPTPGAAAGKEPTPGARAGEILPTGGLQGMKPTPGDDAGDTRPIGERQGTLPTPGAEAGKQPIQRGDADTAQQAWEKAKASAQGAMTGSNNGGYYSQQHEQGKQTEHKNVSPQHAQTQQEIPNTSVIGR